MAASRATDTLFSMMLAVRRVVRAELKKTRHAAPAYSVMQFETLHYLNEHETPLMHDIARHFLISPPAATFLIEGMRKTGLVTRRLDARDHRGIRLGLTPKGRKLLKRAVTERSRVFEKVFSVLNAKEKDALAEILQKVVKKRDI